MFIGMGHEIVTTPLSQIPLKSKKCCQRFHIVLRKLPGLFDPFNKVRKFPLGARIAITRCMVSVPVKPEGTHSQDLVLTELSLLQISTSSI